MTTPEDNGNAAAAKSWVENNEDVEVRRMYGHYYRCHIAGATSAILRERERLRKLVEEMIAKNKQEAKDNYDGSEESNRECFHLDQKRRGMEAVLPLLESKQ